MNLSFLPETNWVDIIVVIFLIRGGYVGLHEGFAVEFFKSLGALVATVVAFLCYLIPSEWFSAHSFLPVHIAQIISFVVIFFAILFAFKCLRIFLLRVLHIQFLGRLESVLGLIIGVARGLVFASLFIFMLSLFPIDYLKASIEERSLSGAYVKEVAPVIKDFIVRFEPKDKETE